MYFDLLQQMKKQLGQLPAWFDAASAHATSRGFSPDAFLAMRLAPDQFALVKQVQIVCDTLKLGAARVTGKDAPSHADDEQTLDALRARIASVSAFLDTLTADDFASVAERTITQPRWEGRTMTGHDYFLEYLVPNFYFHVAHVYALLRHGGVALGKRDYLGALSMRAP
jgi:hypothetical protein